MLAAMKTLELREENAMLAQVSLCEMHQERDETIYSFSAHVHAQILACNYLKSCHNS